MYESGSVSHPVFSNSLQLHGLYPTRLLCLWGFSKLEYWSGLPLPSQGDVSNPGIQPRFLALQADSLLSEPPENIYIHKYLYFRVNGAIMQLFLHHFPYRVTTVICLGFPGDPDSKESACNAGDTGSIPWEGPLEEEMATHSSILAWRILWTKEPGGLQSMGLQRVGHNWATNTFTSLSCILTCQYINFNITMFRDCIAFYHMDVSVQ